MARILIVEDEPDIGEVFERGLLREGHVVEVVTDGRSAYDRIFEAGDDYDLILTDLFLPRMNGVDLLQGIWPVIRGRTPFIVVSGVATLIEELGELADQAAAILHKPVDLVTVLDTVRTVLARPTPERPAPRPLQQRLQILLQQNEDLFLRVRIDALTELPNRRRWLDDLRVLEANARRYGSRFALAVVDIDRFGRFNKHYGLVAGDSAIRLVARVLRTGCRGGDAVYRYRDGRREAQPDAYRYGGDEFLVVLRAEDLATASRVMDRIRQQLAEAQAEADPLLPPEKVTISAGVAVYDPEELPDCEALFERAQARMREAKAAGGDRVRPEPPATGPGEPIRTRGATRSDSVPHPLRRPSR